MRRAFLVVVMAWASSSLAGVKGLPEAIHQSLFIGRVHVDSVESQPGRYAQRASTTVTDILRGKDEKSLSILAADQGFSGVELSLLAGSDALVFLRREPVDGKDAWILVESFRITRDGMLTLGDGSSTWWVMEPMPLATARTALVKAISDDNRLPRTPPDPGEDRHPQGALMGVLVAVDLGLRSGLAVFGEDGKLRAFKSNHFASMAALKRAVFGLLRDAGMVRWVVLEGDAHMAEVWAKAAAKQGAQARRVSAEMWRAQTLLPREMRSGSDAKEHAEILARRVVDWSGARQPATLSHDVAEAILIGLFGVIQVGWLKVPPGWRP